MDNSTKMGSIMQSYADAEFKYIIYSTESIEVLQNAQEIGKANTYKEACIILDEYLKEIGRARDPYWRFIMNENATFIDYGSWSHFAAIVPPVPMKVITGEVEEF